MQWTPKAEKDLAIVYSKVLNRYFSSVAGSLATI
jgi:hypothetical protein